MKKHFFNVIAALALVCGVFAFSGCTDYEEDINAINDRQVSWRAWKNS